MVPNKKNISKSKILAISEEATPVETNTGKTINVVQIPLLRTKNYYLLKITSKQKFQKWDAFGTLRTTLNSLYMFPQHLKSGVLIRCILPTGLLREKWKDPC